MFLIQHWSGFCTICGAAFFFWLMAMVLGIILRRHSGNIFSYLNLGGSMLLLTAAIVGKNEIITIPLPWFLGDAGFSMLIDPLSRWFLAIIGLVGIPVALFAPGYLLHLQKQVSLGLVWAGLALLMISMAGVVLAANAIFFIVAWELMALSSFFLVASNHEQKESRHASFIYLGATRIGTAFLMGGFLWMHYLTGSWNFSDWGISGFSALGPALLIFIGLATKAGCWPFHLWLPIAHPAAPAPVSALMSGVMIKTAIYAMARLFIIGPHINVPILGKIILILGAISAFWGVIFALLQHDLKRLLAYHSVENIGIIMMGLGISMLGSLFNQPLLIQLGLAAALFHTLNHAIFKSLLFLGAGAIDARTHLRDIEQMGGLIRRMPWTAGAFIVGSAAICALPPLNGFASEWMLYQGFFNLALSAPLLGFRLGGLLLMGILALIGVLAIACFVKAVSIAFLGNPRSPQAEHAKEGNSGMVAAQLFLSLFCLGLGLAVPLLINPLGVITSMTGSHSQLGNVWSIPIGILTLLLIVTVGALAAWRFTLVSLKPGRKYNTWDCGFGILGPRTQYTATSFAQPISRIFGSIYHYAVEISTKGRQRRHFPEAVNAETMYEAYLETKLYRPFLSAVQRFAGTFLMRLQAGSIHQYLIYILLVLGLLLWVGVLR